MKSILVAGVDVSRKFSDMCILSSKNDVFARLKIYHDLTSMERASEALHDAEKKLGGKPVIVMESTSHYHLLLFQFFKDAGYDVIVVNPIQSGALRNINVRKIKTDKADAYKIAMLYRMKDSALITAVVAILKLLLESVAQIDREIDALTQQDAYLRETLALLQTIPASALSLLLLSSLRSVISLCSGNPSSL